MRNLFVAAVVAGLVTGFSALAAGDAAPAHCGGGVAMLLLRLNGRSPGLAAVCAGNRRYGLA